MLEQRGRGSYFYMGGRLYLPEFSLQISCLDSKPSFCINENGQHAMIVFSNSLISISPARNESINRCDKHNGITVYYVRDVLTQIKI